MPEDNTAQTDTSTADTGTANDDTTTTKSADAPIIGAGQPAASTAPVERHPAHGVLDEIEAAANRMGSYVVSELKHLIDRARSLI